MPDNTSEHGGRIIRRAGALEQGPSMFFLTLDLPPSSTTVEAGRRKKRAAAAYMFRYIALPARLWRMLAPHSLEEFATGDPDFFQRPAHSLDVVQRMRRAHQELMQASNEILLHEISHHEGLRKSCFWLYVNLCLGVRRLLFTYAVGKGAFTPSVLNKIENLYSDIFIVKRELVELDELRQRLEKEDSEQRQPGQGYLLQQIANLYADTSQLWHVLRNGSFSSRNSTTRKLLFPRTFIMFVWRHWSTVLLICPYIVRRLLAPKVIREFTIPLIRNLSSRGTEVTRYPVIRTFLSDGKNTSLDPQAVLVNEGMCATSLETLLLRERFSQDAFRKVCWWNYLLILRARGEVFSDASADLAYRFLSDYLYDTDTLGTELWALDRTVLELCSRHGMPLRGDLLGEILKHVEASRDRYRKLSRQQLFTYVKHFFDHGA